MNVIDKIVTEWAFRCKKGYPDMNNPEDMKILKEIYSEYGVVMEEEEKNKDYTEPTLDTVIDLVKANSDNKKLLTRIYRTLSASKAIDQLKEVLSAKGINKSTFDGRSVQSEIIGILMRGQQNEVQEFLDIVETRKIPESGNIYANINTVSKEKIKQIAKLSGAKGSVTMGNGEILFPLLFNNIKLLGSKAGDFLIDSSVVELKDVGGRLGEGRAATKYIPLSSTSTTIKNLLDSIIEDFNNITNKEQAVNHIKEFIKNTYYRGESKQDISLTEKDLANTDSLQLKMYEEAVKGYAETKTIGKFILFNSKEGSFRMYTPEQLIQAIKRKEVELTNITKSSTIPQIKSFK